MHGEFIRWSEHRIFVSDTGEGKPLLLISGLGCSAELWNPLTERLTARRIIRFDAPGAGRSSTPAYPITVASLAGLAAAVLNHYELSCTDVIGFSYGGAIAQQLAYVHPDRIRRLVLAATTCGVGAVLGSVDAMAVLSTPFRFYSPTYFQRTAAAVYGGVTGRDPAARRRSSETRRNHPPSSYGYAMQLLGGTGWSSWPFLHHIPHETLIVSGDDDPLVPVANAEMLASRIPRARLEIVQRAGHLLLWDEPANLAPRIGRFLDSTVRRTRAH